jgi:hypothetical protein
MIKPIFLNIPDKLTGEEPSSQELGKPISNCFLESRVLHEGIF